MNGATNATLIVFAALLVGPLTVVHAAEVGGEQGGTQLFNLARDIGETQNLAAAQPDVLNRLQKAYVEWNQDNITPAFESPRAKPKVAKKVRGGTG